jgi:hypothetical protein
LQRRLASFIKSNNLLCANQGGFRKGYRTTEHVFISKTLINKYVYKCKTKLYVYFVDFKKAVDTVWRSALFLKLRATCKGIKGKLYNILHDMYSNTLYACKYQHLYTETFKANQGVKQGDSLKTTLFNTFVDDIGKYFDPNITEPVNLGDQNLYHLLYADHLLLISESPTGLQNCLNSLQRYSADWKLAVNFDKTKIVVFSKQKLNKGIMYFYYGPNSIEIVETYKYLLGILFCYSGKFSQAMSNLADKARKAYFALK